jgi:hypothetical protein
VDAPQPMNRSSPEKMTNVVSCRKPQDVDRERNGPLLLALATKTRFSAVAAPML